MERRVNRAEVLLENWKALERNLVGFWEANGSSQVELIKQQHGFLWQGLNRISLDPMPQEKAHVALLKGAVSRMEMVLWPNPLIRFFMRLKAALIDRPKQIKAFKEMKGLNERELKGFLIEKGFSVLVPRLANELDYERPWFGMKMSGQLDKDRQIELELQVVKMFDGKYYPSLISGTLVEADGKKLNHDFLLSDDMLDAPMVTNLLQGRAVCILEREGRENKAEKWIQVHFEKGDSHLRSFYPDYGVSAVVLLKELATGMGMPGLSDERLVAELRNGNQVSVIAGAPFHKKFLIEVDPSSRSLLVRDETGAQVQMRELFEKRKAFELSAGQEIKAVQLNAGKSKGKGREQDHGISM